jgi:hypothetical protein
MEQAEVLQDGLLVHFESDPQLDFSCEICKAASGRTSIPGGIDGVETFQKPRLRELAFLGLVVERRWNISKM